MAESDVRELHKPVGREMYATECAEAECGHEDVDCPLEETTVCDHCFETALASDYSKTEDTTPIYTWPCPTMRALNKPGITVVMNTPRCIACGQLGHNCPTGGRLLR